MYLPHHHFVAFLQTLQGHADIPETQCFVKGDSTVLMAVLGDDSDFIEASGFPDIYVRLADHTILARVTRYWHGPVPGWVA